jgi:hypothetical protein
MNGVTWNNRIRHVNDGEPVNGAIDSRPTRALEGNTQYLKSRIDAAELGEAVCAYGETVESAAQIGMAVYRNAVTAQYERALAGVEVDPANPTSGTLVPLPSCDTVGIIVFKYNATKADILLAGRRQVDITQAVGPADIDPVLHTPIPGRYYLSAATPGVIVRQRPPVSVSVLVYTDDGMAIVQPIQRDFLEDHIHYKVKLFAEPAGENGISSTSGAARRFVQNPNPNFSGWLPATSTYFSVPIPTGAAFGYNLAMHPELAQIFPPIPPSGAAIFLDRGENYLGGTLIPAGPGGLCSVDRFGIWWMSDCDGDQPWPSDWTAPVEDETGNPATGPECPRTENFQIILSYTMMVFTTERTTVTSLQPAADSPELRFTDCNDADATTGDLYAHLDLEFLVDTENLVTGPIAFKRLDGITFRQGLVVEGLQADANSGCELLSTNPTPQLDGSILHQGTVKISIDTVSGERELPAELIRLAQTEERFYMEIPYIGFDSGRDTSIRMRFNVPAKGIPDTPQVALRMQLIGRGVNGTLPIMTATYRILNQPPLAPTQPAPPAPPVTTPINLPGVVNEQVLTINTHVLINSDQYVQVESVPIPVTAGDTILVNLVRTSNDGYPGEVGLMRPAGILTAVPLVTGP